METVVLFGAVTGWAAVHSWLASLAVKEAAAKWLGEHGMRWYRLAYNTFSVLTFAPIALLMRILPDQPVYNVAAPWEFLFWAGQGLGLALMVLTLLRTDWLHFAGISQLALQKPSSGLVRTGFYGMVRHPLYLFGLLVLWLMPRMTANQLSVSIALTIYLFVGARLEERRLVQEFGSDYEEYRSRVPMIIPSLSARRRQ